VDRIYRYLDKLHNKQKETIQQISYKHTLRVLDQLIFQPIGQFDATLNLHQLTVSFLGFVAAVVHVRSVFSCQNKGLIFAPVYRLFYMTFL